MRRITNRATKRYWHVNVVLVMLTALAVAASEAAEQTPLEKAKAAVQKASHERAEAEKVASEKIATARKAAAETAAVARKAAEVIAAARKTAQQARAAKSAAEKKLAQKVAAENAAKRKLVAELAYHTKIAAEKAVKEKANAQRQLAQKARAARKASVALAAAEKASAQAHAAKAAAEKTFAEKVATAEAANTAVAAVVNDESKKKVAQEVAKKVATVRVAAEKAFAEKSVAAKAAADKVAEAKKGAEKANGEKAAAEKTVSGKAAAVTAALDQAASAHAVALGGLKPLAASQWNYAKARHLLVRAGFGGTPDEVQKLYEMGLHKAVDYMVDIYDRPQASNSFDVLRLERPEPWEAKLEGDERTMLSNRRTQRERRQQAELRRWWLKRMAKSPRPLQEKLTLFWHDHFAVQYKQLYRTYILYKQNQLFRTYGCDNYAALLHGIIQDPAMLRFLDNHRNFKGRGNENLGRELQELFSIGEEFSANHAKNGYTEEDVREVSRALTGYSYDSWTGQFRFLNSRHDKKKKTVLGRTGNFSGNEVVNIILRHPSTAKYVSKKLFIFFAYENPKPEITDQLAHVLRTCSYNLRPMLKNLFLSEVFYSDLAMGTHIKSPVELLVGTIRDLGINDVNYASVDSAAIAMGQMLFEPPSVAGWDENQAWINAERILTRYNRLSRLVERRNVDVVALLEGKGVQTPEQVVDFLAKACLVRSPSDAKRKELISFLGKLPPKAQWGAKRKQINAKLRAVVALLMSMPESQLG